MKNLIAILILISIALSASAQNKVHFYSDNYRKAVAIAKIEGKDVFIDTWATWCVPCKRQEKVFDDPRVIKYLNKNFINLRINMESTDGDRMNSEYEVVFLPSLILIDNDGKLKSKVENFMGADELLTFLRLGKDKAVGKFESRLNNVPFDIGGADEVIVRVPPVTPKKKVAVSKEENIASRDKNVPPPKKNTTQKQNEIIKPIPQQHGNNDAGGEILFEDDKDNIVNLSEYYYNQTSLKLQNMDSDYKLDYNNYLELEKDWETDKNLKFIYNYVYSVQAPGFEYMIHNRDKFTTIMGHDRVQKSIEILIYNRLYQGFPRPNYDEALKLFGHVYDKEFSKKSAQYYTMDKLNAIEKYKELIDYGKKCSKLNPSKKIYYTIANTYLDKLDKPKKALKWIKKALEMDNNDYTLYLLRAKSYLQLQKYSKAKKAALKAKSIATKQNVKLDEWDSLIQKIEKKGY